MRTTEDYVVSAENYGGMECVAQAVLALVSEMQQVNAQLDMLNTNLFQITEAVGAIR